MTDWDYNLELRAALDAAGFSRSVFNGRILMSY